MDKRWMPAVLVMWLVIVLLGAIGGFYAYRYFKNEMNYTKKTYMGN